MSAIRWDAEKKTMALETHDLFGWEGEFFLTQPKGWRSKWEEAAVEGATGTRLVANHCRLEGEKEIILEFQ